MSVEETAEKIRTMEIRGAGLIARAAAGSMKDMAQEFQGKDTNEFLQKFTKARNILSNTRPTAVSLNNALDFIALAAKGESVEKIKQNVISAADEFINNSLQAVNKIAELCSGIINSGNTILTHCNSSVSVQGIINAHNAGKKIKVFATETRPWLQGHITSQKLANAEVDVTLIVDSAVRYFMPEIDLIIVGADTISPDGTLINKIGTSQIALIAHEKRIPFIVCAETYKFSRDAHNSDSVIIEERDTSEIVEPGKLNGVKVRNPVFDSTPPEYIKSIITEVGIISPNQINEVKDKIFSSPKA
jgi:ribose 1,5-bisphosphate isomerase